MDDQCMRALMALEDEQGFSSDSEPEYLTSLNSNNNKKSLQHQEPSKPKNDGLAFLFEDLERPANTSGVSSGENLKSNSTQKENVKTNQDPKSNLEIELEQMRKKVLELEQKLSGNPPQPKQDVQKPQRIVLSPKNTYTNNTKATVEQLKNNSGGINTQKCIPSSAPTANNVRTDVPQGTTSNKNLKKSPVQSPRPNSQQQGTMKTIPKLPQGKTELDTGSRQVENPPLISRRSNQPQSQTKCEPSSAVKRKYTEMADHKEEAVWKDKFSGLSIINPMISSTTMNQRMEGRKVIRVGILHKHSTAGKVTVDGDWVTTGVLATKMAPRKSSNGRTFSIWKLNDLKDCERFVAFFLFGDVYQQLWKTVEGSVLAILNPSVMPPKDNVQSDEVALNVDNAQKVMVIGTSKDFGKCQSRKKNGDPCTNIINKSTCEYCSFHVQSTYKKICSHRGEFQYGVPEPKSKMQKKIFNNGMYMYGGQTYTVSPSDSSSKKKSGGKLSLAGLHVPGAKKVAAEAKSQLINTVSGPMTVTGCSQEFSQLLTLPTTGSVNLVRHLETDQKKDALHNNKFPDKRTASDLLKEHQRIVQSSTRGQRRGLTPRPPDPLLAHRSPLSHATRTRPHSLQSARASTVSPQLGRGLGDMDSLISLDVSPPSFTAKNMEIAADITSCVFPERKSAGSDKAKSKALRILHHASPLQKTDPNAVKKTTSPETQSKINVRVEKSVQGSSSAESCERTDDVDNGTKKLASEDPEFLKLMNVTSSHAGAVSEAEQEHQERYFKELERKEQMEMKMGSITEIQTKAVVCHQCKYLALGPAASCKEAGHSLTWSVTKKRFFACRQCNTRTITLDRYPNKPCHKCGSNKYSKTGMCKEKQGPKLESEILQIRGEECKFLNSLR